MNKEYETTAGSLTAGCMFTGKRTWLVLKREDTIHERSWENFAVELTLLGDDGKIHTAPYLRSMKVVLVGRYPVK